MRPSFPTLLTLAQIGATAMALALFGMWPPNSGKMLLVPLDGADQNDMARVALSSGAALLARGPLPGSLVVVGSRAELSHHSRGWKILILTAPALGCGERVNWVANS